MSSNVTSHISQYYETYSQERFETSLDCKVDQFSDQLSADFRILDQSVRLLSDSKCVWESDAIQDGVESIQACFFYDKAYESVILALLNGMQEAYQDNNVTGVENCLSALVLINEQVKTNPELLLQPDPTAVIIEEEDLGAGKGPGFITYTIRKFVMRKLEFSDSDQQLLQAAGRIHSCLSLSDDGSGDSQRVEDITRYGAIGAVVNCFRNKEKAPRNINHDTMICVEALKQFSDLGPDYYKIVESHLFREILHWESAQMHDHDKAIYSHNGICEALACIDIPGTKTKFDKVEWLLNLIPENPELNIKDYRYLTYLPEKIADSLKKLNDYWPGREQTIFDLVSDRLTDNWSTKDQMLWLVLLEYSKISQGLSLQMSKLISSNLNYTLPMDPNLNTLVGIFSEYTRTHSFGVFFQDDLLEKFFSFYGNSVDKNFDLKFEEILKNVIEYAPTEENSKYLMELAFACLAAKPYQSSSKDFRAFLDSEYKRRPVIFMDSLARFAESNKNRLSHPHHAIEFVLKWSTWFIKDEKVPIDTRDDFFNAIKEIMDPVLSDNAYPRQLDKNGRRRFLKHRKNFFQAFELLRGKRYDLRSLIDS